MKSIFALALALIASGSLATAQDATKQVKIERILALTNADAVMDQMFAQIKKDQIPKSLLAPIEQLLA